jgi:diguanylate cyclase (GGDEF)-like protein
MTKPMTEPPAPKWSAPAPASGHESSASHDGAPARRRGDALQNEPAPRPTPEELLGLPNRRRMQDAIDAAYEHLRAGGVASGVVLIDLDGLAHADDDTRVGLAKRLSSILRRDDLVARFAGDVFVVVARDVADDAAAHGLAARLKRELDKPLLDDGAPSTVSASIGVSIMRAHDTSGTDVVTRADAALYAAKNKTSRDAHPGAPAPEGSREALVAAAFECTTIEDFDLYYRPIADLRNGSVAAVEAVLRWEHPDLGTIHPAEFIPLARRLGQIVTLGRWSIEKACCQTIRWAPTRDGQPMRTYVTVSAEQVTDPAFTDDIESALARGGATGHKLALQLTEQTLGAVPERVLALLAEARIELVLIDAVADEGLAGRLPEAPIAAIRIARTILTDDGATPALAATAQLARDLGVRAIAAGVVHRYQLAAVRACDIPLAQGPLFSRPQSASAIEQLVYRERPFASLLAPRPSWLDLPDDGDMPTIEISAPAVP